MSSFRALSALTMALFLAAPVTHADGLADLIEGERAAFDAAVRAYLLENPEIIVEAMTELQAREERAAAESDLRMLADNHAAIFDSPDDWNGGNLEGDLTIVEFMDYKCPYCYQAYKAVDELVATDGNIRFVLKELPVLGEKSVMGSRFAIAMRQLHGDDAYKAAHDALFEIHGDVDEDALRDIARAIGHDPDPVLARMDAPEVSAIIEANYALANTAEISGTPTFIVENAMVRGYVPVDGMRQIVATQRQNRARNADRNAE